MLCVTENTETHASIAPTGMLYENTNLFILHRTRLNFPPTCFNCCHHPRGGHSITPKMKTLEDFQSIHFCKKHNVKTLTVIIFVLLNDLPVVGGNSGQCPRTRLKIQQYCRLPLTENGTADNLTSLHFLNLLCG